MALQFFTSDITKYGAISYLSTITYEFIKNEVSLPNLFKAAMIGVITGLYIQALTVAGTAFGNWLEKREVEAVAIQNRQFFI